MSALAPLTPEGQAAVKAADAAALRVALVAANGAVEKVAESLGVSRSRLYRHLDALGLRAWLDKTYPSTHRGKRAPVTHA